MTHTDAAHPVLEGLSFAESPRWHDDRVWVSDWATGTVWSVGPDGAEPRVEARVGSFPLCIDFLPDGRLLLVAAGALLRRETSGVLVTHADLSRVSDKPWNDIVVGADGRAYVDNIGFAFPGEDFAPGTIALVTPDGTVRSVADGLAFPNGMALWDDTLIVAESYASQLTAFTVATDGSLRERRVWAPTPGHHPDGICLDGFGDCWYADVATGTCTRVRAGGEVMSSVVLDRGAFACTLSRSGAPRLFVVGQNWDGVDAVGGTSGRVVSFPAPSGGAGHP